MQFAASWVRESLTEFFTGLSAGASVSVTWDWRVLCVYLEGKEWGKNGEAEHQMANHFPISFQVVVLYWAECPILVAVLATGWEQATSP
jgi:hypothetical protein